MLEGSFTPGPVAWLARSPDAAPAAVSSWGVCDGHGIQAELVSYEMLLACSAPASPRPVGDDEIAFVQFSSGTTSRPRGVALTPPAIDSQLSRLAERLDALPGRDAAYIWLPLSHDMGLFGWLMCWYAGIPCHVATPERFLGSPWTWLDDCAELGVTISPVPPFALGIAARAIGRSRSPERLDSMRRLIVGGERIELEPLERALDVLAARGLQRTAIAPAYGLAEATLAVTLAEEGRPLAASPRGGDSPPVLASGTPLRDVEVRIDAESPEREGEICVRTPSLSTGYVGDPELTAQRFVEGELRTGDLGFVRDGELHVLGRSDDLLVLGGPNLYAQDVETALVKDSRLRAGACAVVDLPAGGYRPRYVLVSETAPAVDDFETLGRTLATEGPDGAVRIELRRVPGADGP